MSKVEAKEIKIRKLVRVLAIFVIVAGAAVFGFRIYETFFARSFIDAAVIATTPQEGQCRRPSGRYQSCTQTKAALSFTPRGANAETHVELLIPARGVTLKAGDTLKISYRNDNPSDVLIPDIEVTFRTPLGSILMGIFLLTIEWLTRSAGSSGVISRGEQLPG